MGFFDFAKKKETASPAGTGNIPISQVLSMKAQGMNNAQIANQLRAVGFSLTQIRDAMAQADIKSAVVPGGAEMELDNRNMPTGGPIPEMPDMNMPDMPGDFSDSNQMEMPPLPDVPAAPVASMPQYPMQGQQYQQPMQQFQQPMGMPMQRSPVSEQLINELQRVIEEIIEEKWNEVEDKLNSLDVWKARIEGQMTEAMNRVNILSKRLDDFSKGMMEKTEGYQSTMEDVGTQMEAVEKLMGKLIPSLAEEIKELRNVTDKLKKK